MTVLMLCGELNGGAKPATESIDMGLHVVFKSVTSPELESQPATTVSSTRLVAERVTLPESGTPDP